MWEKRTTNIGSTSKLSVLKKPKMQKALSLNQGKQKYESSGSLSFKLKSNNYNLDESFKVIKDSTTNRTDDNSKESSAVKRNKSKIRRKWWNGRAGWIGNIASTKIKINMEAYSHLDNHPINIAIKCINNFIHHAFKIKSKDDYDIPTILNLGKPLGIIYNKTQIVDHNFLRSREFLSFSKEKILRYLYNAINKSNCNIEPDNSKSLAPFHQNRFYVGKGNNYILVKTVIKQRWWWSMNETEDFFNVNFLWTQWRKNKHLWILDTKKEWKSKAMLELKQQVIDERENASTSEEEGSPKNSPYNENQEIMFQTKIYNRLEDNFHLSNKKALFWNMSEYYKSMNKSPWNALPVTFHIENGLTDIEYIKFLDYYQKIEYEIQNKTMYKNRVLQERARKSKEKEKQEKLNRKKSENLKRKHKGKREAKSEVTSSDSESPSEEDSDSEDEEESDDDEFKIPKNMWIVKPGENTNRGNGIQVWSTLQEVNNIIRTWRPRKEPLENVDKNAKLEDIQRRTFILQKYIDRPLLIKGRKFDIRAFGTLTSINGWLKGYFYEDGYIRTSSSKYTSKSNDIFIHLTNDAVQKHSDTFGKYESGNKLSFHDFQKYINSHYGELNIWFYRDILPQIK